KPNEYTETKITATPNLCGVSQGAIYNTFVYGGTYSSYELLSVYKIDTSDPVQSGSPLTYQIVISNVGNPLSNVRLTETYPPNTSFASANSSSPCVKTGNNIWDFSLLPSGNTIITVTLNVANGLANGTILNNTVAVSNNGTIYDTYTETTTVVSAPDLTITKTASVINSPAGPGSTVNYTLTYTNNGNYPASGVIIKDNYDETYLNIGNIGQGINAGGEITWNIPSLNPGTSGTINYSMIIKSNSLLFFNGSTNIINSAVISSNLPDRNINDNISTATVNVFVLPDLKIEETANPAIGLVNQPITYTISVSNIGKLDHTSGTYTVVDYLPASSTYFSSTPAGGVYSSGTVSWTINDNLPVNETKNFTVTLEDLPCNLVGTGSLSNRVTVNSNTYGDANNTNQEVVLVSNVVDNVLPTITCSGPVSINNDSGQCSAIVMLTTPTTADNCGILSVTNDHPSTTYPIGTTIVTWTATDIHGNINACEQNVTVADNEKPIVTAPSNIRVNNDAGICGAIVVAGTATVTDNCIVGSLKGKRSDALELTDVYPVGSTTIIWSYDDGHGSIATASQNVFVYDSTPPLTPVLADVTVGECSGTPTVPTTMDNCSGIITGTTATIFPITTQGTTKVTWSFDDGNGNVATALQNVIVDDVTPPLMPVLADVNV
ncbi:MAG TPA: hypothetical protein DCL77_03005, partial [Prolixibacteraceae bacterium]|nr:hypothetical protein [Prolixibacteraceae bacterium]